MMGEDADYRALLNELADFGYPEEAGVRSEIAQWAAGKVAQVIADEREACAKLAEWYMQHSAFFDGPGDAAKKIAALIRRRGMP